MLDLLIKVAVNAVALLAAANVVPEFKLVFHNDNPEDWSSSISGSPWAATRRIGATKPSA
jgi:hypothetical protein